MNVVDLMRLQDERGAPARAVATRTSTRCSRRDKPVIFAYHGYPWLIHRLTYRRTNHANIHVRGYMEEGTTTTPFDMTVLNQLDRFDLAIDVIDRVPRLRGTSGARARGAEEQADRAPASTSGPTARTCPRSATGSGRRGRAEPCGASSRRSDAQPDGWCVDGVAPPCSRSTLLGRDFSPELAGMNASIRAKGDNGAWR